MSSLKCIYEKLCELIALQGGPITVTPDEAWQALFEAALENALTSQLEGILTAALEGAEITVNAVQSGTWTVDVGDVTLDADSIAALVAALEAGGPYTVVFDDSSGTLTVTLDQAALDALENITVTIDTSGGPVTITGTVTIDQSGGPLQVEVTNDLNLSAQNIADLVAALDSINVTIDNANSITVNLTEDQVDALSDTDDTDDDLRPVPIACYCWTNGSDSGSFLGYGLTNESGAFQGWQVVSGSPPPAGAVVSCQTAKLLDLLANGPCPDGDGGEVVKVKQCLKAFDFARGLLEPGKSMAYRISLDGAVQSTVVHDYTTSADGVTVSSWYTPIVAAVNAVPGWSMTLVQDVQANVNGKPTYELGFVGVGPSVLRIDKAGSVASLGTNDGYILSVDAAGNITTQVTEGGTIQPDFNSPAFVECPEVPTMEFGEAAGEALVVDNFQDGDNQSPFNLQVRNATAAATGFTAVLPSVPYSTISPLVEGPYTHEVSKNADETFQHVFKSTTDLAGNASITITGGVPNPPGVGGVGNVDLYLN